MPTRTLLHALLLLVALLVFSWVMMRRAALLRRGAPDPRTDRLGERMRRLLVIGFGQARQPRYLVAGVLHIVLFAGFVVLSLRSLTLLGEGFRAGFHLPGLGGSAGHAYAVIKDVVAAAVLAACVVAIVRRAVFRPARYHDRFATGSHAGEAYVILGLISLLMVADAVYEGAGIAAGAIAGGLPLAGLAAGLLSGLDAQALGAARETGFWVHNVALLSFLCYLPVSKHFHVITSLPNVFLSNVGTPGAVKPPRHEVERLDDVKQLGVGHLEDFTWKHLLDFYTCTDCGRCSDHCPAYATGTPLSPRMLSIKSRDCAYDRYPMFGTLPADGERTPLVGPVITEAELWACTTCGACEEACPVTIEYVDKIVDMRRWLVDRGEVPEGLQKVLSDLDSKGNPYGKPARVRGDWAKDTAVRVLPEGDEADVLFFADSTTSFDPRIQRIGQSLARVMEAAGEDVGTLGRDEVDSGNDVRRIGEEGLFEALRGKNQEAMEARTFDRIVTNDPHALNALRNDGYATGKPVQHHSEYLAELVAGNKLKLGPLGDDRTYTFHDPCYLGRHNGVYDAPRHLLAAVPGLKTVEMERSKNRSFCCGGGLLSLYNEGESESRMGEKRLAMAADAGAQVVVTACPFCMINLEDAVKTTGRDLEIIDLAELVARSAGVAGDVSRPEDNAS